MRGKTIFFLTNAWEMISMIDSRSQRGMNKMNYIFLRIQTVLILAGNTIFD